MRRLLVLLLCLALLTACSGQPRTASEPEPTEPAPTVTEAASAPETDPTVLPEPEGETAPIPTTEETSAAEQKEETDMRLLINDTPVEVLWEDNEAVTALRELVRDGALTVAMSPYGGFEQVGPIGRSLPRADSRITTEAGDIVLYSGDQIVVFYGSNTWAYTRLGKIQGLDGAALTSLLGGGAVTLTITD